MRYNRIAVLSCAVAALLSPAADAQVNDASEATVRAALARHDQHAAAVSYNALVTARLPAKASGRPDPVLDRLMVEQMVAVGGQPPRPVLERIAGDTAAPDRLHNLLLLATVEESAGEDDRAATHYGAVDRSPHASADQRLSALLGMARLKLGTDAPAAVAILEAIPAAAIPTARRWEVALQLSRAIATASPANAARQAAQLEQAWAAAPDGGFADNAIARVATDRAIAAARAGDRARLVTLLAVDRSNRGANTGQNPAAADLPICGENGLTRDDAAIVEMQRIPAAERPAVALVWASRPGIGKPFLDAARRSGQLAVADGAVAQFMLRCRSTPSPDYTVGVRLDDAIGGWMTGKGAYPLAVSGDDENPTQLAAMLADRTTRYGATSIIRLPILLRLTNSIFPQITPDDQSRARVTDLIAQVSAVLDVNAAPDDVKLLWKMTAIGMSIATQTRTPAQAQADFQTLLVAAAANPAVSRDLLYSIAAGLVQQVEATSALKEAILGATLELFAREGKNDPRARALALRLYGLRSGNGEQAGARAAIAGRDIAADACITATPPPRYASSNIRADDYPGDVIRTAIVGANATEFDLDASGQAINGRLLVSDPPFIFDDVSRLGVATIRYDPPRRDGAPQACRAMTQSVRWQLPY